MKHFLFFMFSFLSIAVTKSQDLIVTKTNDSIHCKITKVKSDHIYFVYKKDDRYEKTLISLTEVASYHQGLFEGKKIPKDSIPGYEIYPRHLLTLNSGYSYDPGRRNGDFSREFENYLDQLRSGYHIEASYIYYIDKSLGFGVLGNYFRSSGQESDVSGTDEMGNPIVADLSGEVTVYFVGPLFSLRFLNKSQNNALILNTVVGYIAYEEAATYVSQTITTGNGLGLTSTIGYTIGISEYLSLGVQLGATSGLFRNVEISSGNTVTTVRLPDNERPVSSARLNFSIGLSYRL